MELNEALEKVLRSYEAYYTVRRNEMPDPFAAEAEFHAHGEGYFLMKQAKFAEVDSNEYAFFAVEPVLTAPRVLDLSVRAWATGISRVKLSSYHRASDVLLVILTDELTPAAAQAIRKTRFVKSYRLGLQGYSHFRLAAMEPASRLAAHNRMGEDLGKLLGNIFSV